MASIDRRRGGRRHLRPALSVALLCLLVPGLLLVGARPTPVEAATPAWTAYVTLEAAIAGANAVMPIDTGDNVAGTAIPMPFANMEPEGIAVDPTATTAYVATDQDNALVPIDLASGTAPTAIGLPGSTGGALDAAVTPDGNTASSRTAGAATMWTSSICPRGPRRP
jgi:DNA-binding beta-propeller fold protein YncE